MTRFLAAEQLSSPPAVPEILFKQFTIFIFASLKN
jgi:hypothetical protein